MDGPYADDDTLAQLSQHNEEVKQEAEMSRNTFSDLVRVDCSAHVEKKNGFSYLSWPFAVEQLRKHAPDAVWEVKRNEHGEPFMVTQFGVFVEVAVTVNGITLSQIHPVLDHRNKPVAQPDPFQINTSIQRCLVKAIALHGLGLSIYAGEDVPRDVAAERKTEAEAPITAEQAGYLRGLIEQVGADETKFCAYFKVDSVEKIPASRYDKAVAGLQKKKEVA
jgi:hypothetical protein